MKKFNYLVITIILSIFIVLSFTKLNRSYSRFINYLTISFKDDNKIFVLTNNLDYLINTYSFNENNIIYQNSNDST